MGMEVVFFSLVFFALLVIWLPYHLLHRGQRGNGVDGFLDFIGDLFLAMLFIGLPFLWPYLLYGLFAEAFGKPKAKGPIGTPSLAPTPDPRFRLKAEGKNWL
jgi:hypothetical protein